MSQERIIILPVKMGGSRGIATVVAMGSCPKPTESFRYLGKKPVEKVVTKKGKH